LTLAVTCIVIDPRGWKTLSAAGVLLGLDWLTRGALIGPLLLIFPYLWYRAGFRKMLLTGVMMGLVISPWVIRNYFAFDTLLATSTQSGNVFAGAYNDIVYEDPWADGWINPDQLYLDDVSPETALDEVAYSNYQVQQGRQWILDNPLKVPKLLAAHTLGFIRPWPYITRNDAELVYELLSWGVGVMLLSYGTWMAFRQRNEAILVMLIVILGAFLAGIALYAIPRFRLPFAPMFAVIEAGAVWWLWAAWQVRRESTKKHAGESA
jgi:hypothetical protein